MSEVVKSIFCHFVRWPSCNSSSSSSRRRDTALSTSELASSKHQTKIHHIASSMSFIQLLCSSLLLVSISYPTWTQGNIPSTEGECLLNSVGFHFGYVGN